MNHSLLSVAHLNMTNILGIDNVTDVATGQAMLYVTKCRRGRFGENLCQANWVINIVNIIAGVAACKNDILTQDPENCFAIMDPGTPKVARIWKLCDGRRRCQHAKSKAVTVIECNSTSSTFLTLQYVCLEKSSNLSHNSSTTTISSYIIGTNDSNVANITTTTSGGDPGYGDYTEASTYDPDMITSSFDPGLSSTTTVVDRTPMFTNLEKALIIGIPLTVLMSFIVFVLVSRKFRNRFKFKVTGNKN